MVGALKRRDRCYAGLVRAHIQHAKIKFYTHAQPDLALIIPSVP